MASEASKTLRSKRSSKISKSLAGSVLAKSKYRPNKKKLKVGKKWLKKKKI